MGSKGGEGTCKMNVDNGAWDVERGEVGERRQGDGCFATGRGGWGCTTGQFWRRNTKFNSTDPHELSSPLVCGISEFSLHLLNVSLVCGILVVGWVCRWPKWRWKRGHNPRNRGLGTEGTHVGFLAPHRGCKKAIFFSKFHGQTICGYTWFVEVGWECRWLKRRWERGHNPWNMSLHPGVFGTH